MKWILAILLLISAASFGQVGRGDDSTKYIRYQNQYGQRMPRSWWDSVAHMPYGDTAAFPKPCRPGAIMMHTDKIFYKWNGGGWEGMGSGGGSADSTTFATNYRVDTAKANLRTQIAGKQPAGNYVTAGTGDVTFTGPGSVPATISNNAVTNAKAAQMAAHTFKGNNTGSTANAIDLTATQLTAELNVFGASLKGLVPAAAASPSSSKYLSEDGTFSTPAGGGSSLTAGIQTSVTNSKINYDPRVNSNLIFNDFLLTSIGSKWDASNASSTTITFSNGHMRLVGGSSSDYIFDSVTTILHRWTYETGCIIRSVGSSDYFGIGIQAQGIQTILLKVKNNDLSSTITYNNSATTLGTTTAQGTTAVGDSVIYRIRRDNYVLYFEIVNVTQSTSQTFTYAYTNVDAVSSTVYPFRAFSITLNPTAGTIDIDYAKLFNQERLYADWMIGGMSITEGFNAGPPDSTIYNRLQAYFQDKRFALYALSGSKAIDFLNSGTIKQDMLALRPKRALLMFGINEIQASESTPAFIADMRSLVDTLENHGTQVMICNTTPYNGVNKAAIIAYNSALLTEFRNQVINIYDTLEVNGLMQSSNDSLHPDAQGHGYMFNVLKDEITRLANVPYDPEGFPRIFPRGIESGRSIYGAQSNFGIIPLTVGGSGTNFPSIGYNIKYTPTSGSHTYMGSDVASRMEMGANIGLYTATSGTAGDPITFTPQMYITPTGIGIGSGTSSPVSQLHMKQNGNSLTTLGNSKWLTFDKTGATLGSRIEIGMSYLNGNTYSATIIGTKIVENSGFTNNDFYIANGRDESGDNPPIVRFLIRPSGYTGIKVLDPQQALHVGGQVQIDTVNTGSGSDSVLVINNGVVKKVLQSSIGGGGITSINSQAGLSQTITGSPGVTVNSASDVHTISLTTTLDAQYTDANNSGTSATDLYSKTVSANQLTANGQSLHFEAAGVNNDATATVNLEVLFAGNGIAGTGAVTISSAGVWSIKGMVIRTGSTTARAYVVVTIENSTQQIYSSISNLTGLDFTTTNILKLRATAGGGGGGSNDITAQMWKVTFQP